MKYADLIKNAIAGRTVNAAAKAIGIPQASLDKYSKGARIPGPQAIVLLASAAKADLGEALAACAVQEAIHSPRESFVKKFLTNSEALSNENIEISVQKLCVMLNRVRSVLRRTTDTFALPTPRTTTR